MLVNKYISSTLDLNLGFINHFTLKLLLLWNWFNIKRSYLAMYSWSYLVSSWEPSSLLSLSASGFCGDGQASPCGTARIKFRVTSMIIRRLKNSNLIKKVEFNQTDGLFCLFSSFLDPWGLISSFSIKFGKDTTNFVTTSKNPDFNLYWIFHWNSRWLQHFLKS